MAASRDEGFVRAACPVSIFPWQSDGDETAESLRKLPRLTPKTLISMTKEKDDQQRTSHFLPLWFLSDGTSAKKIAGFGLRFYLNSDLIGEKLRHSLNKRLKNCHFEALSSVDGAHSALSICSPQSISGLLRVCGNTYLLTIAPKDGMEQRNEEDYFELLPFNRSDGGDNICDFTCDHQPRSHFAHRFRHHLAKRALNDQKKDRRPAIPPPINLPDYYADFGFGDGSQRRYVELVFVADNSVYKKYDEDEARVTDRLHSIANVVNSLYSPLNIRVTLVWAEVWKDADRITVTTNPDQTLAKFMDYRKTVLLADHPNDNAHLITEVQFGAVIGKGYRGTMCSWDYSGGVIVDHSDVAAFVGGTVAHEMGHNFGMDHDAGYPEPCRCPAQHCVMEAVSNNINTTTFFSDCSLNYLEHAFKRGVDYCLHNVPESTFGGAKCGNGVVESGEECDCGSIEHCPNRCCIADECRLAQGAQCANGDCCDTNTCQPKSKATMCRRSTDVCDLPEFCDGRNPQCPADFFVQNGHRCPVDADDDSKTQSKSLVNADDYCWEGVCGSRDVQCSQIWGADAHDGQPECYTFNTYGAWTGHCGYNLTTDAYKKCSTVDVQCGLLQCSSPREKPVFGDPSTVQFAQNFLRRSDGKETTCHTIKTSYTGNKKWTNPGMVRNGAKCGKNDLCLDAQCQNRTALMHERMVPRCDPENCNGKGVCNNVGNCHCLPGYGGVSCDLPGFGGSVNSGPATDNIFNPGLVLLYLFIFTLIAFIFGSYFCKRRWDFWLHKWLWRHFRDALNLRSVLVPIRKAPVILRHGAASSQPTAAAAGGPRFSFSDLWGDSHARPQQEVLRVGVDPVSSRPWFSHWKGRDAATTTIAPSHAHPSTTAPTSGHQRQPKPITTYQNGSITQTPFAPSPPFLQQPASTVLHHHDQHRSSTPSSTEDSAAAITAGIKSNGSNRPLLQHNPKRKKSGNNTTPQQVQLHAVSTKKKTKTAVTASDSPPPPVPPHKRQQPQQHSSPQHAASQQTAASVTSTPSKKKPTKPKNPPVANSRFQQRSTIAEPGESGEGEAAKVSVRQLAARFDRGGAKT